MANRNHAYELAQNYLIDIHRNTGGALVKMGYDGYRDCVTEVREFVDEIIEVAKDELRRELLVPAGFPSASLGEPK